MPIYAYRCTSCGHAKDVLQKVSDPMLTDCPACGAATFAKQVTAAGFQLKGSGWYVTDFRGGNNGAPKPEGEAGDQAAADKSAEKSPEKSPEKAADKPAGAPVADKSAAAPVAATPAAAPAPAAPAPSTASPPSSGG